jgi:hypothetical protein
MQSFATASVMELRNILVLILLISGHYCVNAAEAESADEKSVEENKRDSKLLPIFQVVRFPNDVCTGTTYNGTCYTAEECSNKGGTNDGSCASGFGVCCSFSLGCGSSNSENNSYIVQSGATSISNPCKHTICPCSTNVCRIRYDFTTFVLTGPITATPATSSHSPTTSVSQKVGQCFLDTFSVTSPGGPGSPPICGTNSGYHMIVDSNGADCQQANFNISPSTSTTRSWTIRVTQYNCGEEDSSGPPGCLQWYTQTANTIQNFAFPTAITSSSTTITTTTTHLNNQNYNICIRRASGYCYICYNIVAATDPNSFGLSAPPTDANDSAIDADCTTDYLEIPGAMSAANAAIVTPAALGINTISGRICGRQFSFADGATAEATVCSKKKPFRVGVKFDETEICSGTAAQNTCEWDTAPGGINGFKLLYWQNSC